MARIQLFFSAYIMVFPAPSFVLYIVQRVVGMVIVEKLEVWLERLHTGPELDGKLTSVTDPVQRFADDFVDLAQRVAKGCHYNSKLTK